MAITFAVDDVAPASHPLPALDRRLVEDVLGGPAIAGALTEGTLVAASRDVPALLEAVHLAFAQHRPLVLTPDAIWLTIATGLAIHLREHGERLGTRLVRHQGKKTLHVDGVGAPWDAIVGRFATAIGEETGTGLVRLFTASFSTTRDVDRVASVILLMEAMKRHFDYEVGCICGIPTITLEGTPDDWRDIKRRVEVMAEMDLAAWARVLLPLCDRWVATAEGHPDRDFWQKIYKPREAYGQDTVTGWLVRLYPYLGDETPSPNPFHGPNGEPCAPEAFVHEPLSPGAFPPGRTRVEVRVREPGGDAIVELVGGLFGVVQNGLALAAASGWAVREAPVETILGRLRGRHATVPLVSESRNFYAFVNDPTIDALGDRYEEIRFFHGRVVLWGKHRFTYARHPVRMPDGTFDLGPVRIGSAGLLELWAIDTDRRASTIALGSGEGSPRVVAWSGLEFVQRLTDADAREPYFEAPGFVPAPRPA